MRTWSQAGSVAKVEARKNGAYTTTLERQVERFGNDEWFVLVSFDVSGKWGVGTWELFAEGCNLVWRQRSADLSH